MQNQMPHPNLGMFLFVGVFVVCWRFAPEDNDVWQYWFIVGLFCLIATMGIMGSFNVLRAIRGPRPPRLLPPAWFNAWAAIIFFAYVAGTPHIEIDTCEYLGWNGLVEKQSGPCPSVIMLKVREMTP